MTGTGPLNIKREMAALRQMTVAALRERYAEVHGEPTRSGNKDWLMRRVAWRMQANAEGDLSERARARAAELAKGADIRLSRPMHTATLPTTYDKPQRDVIGHIMRPDPRLPQPGTMLKRRYRGRDVVVRVLHDGFEYDGQTYRSLTAVAEAVTGSHWSGHHFFNLTRAHNTRRSDNQ